MTSTISPPDSLDKLRVRQPRPRRVKVIVAPTFSPLRLLSDLANLWPYRDLLYTLSVHRVKVRYKQSLLGVSWALLQPLSLMLIYTIIFSYIARMPSDGAPYAIFAYTALLPWTTFATALSNATNGVVSHSGLITKVYFPREILPLSYVIAAVVDFAVAAVGLAGLLFYYRVPLTLNVLFVVPLLLTMMLLVLAVALFLSALQVRFRDVGVAMPLLLQIWMFATPIIYPLSSIMGSSRLPAAAKFLYSLNPMVGIVENFRRVLLHSAPPDFTSFALAVGVVAVLLPLTYIYFKQMEATMADVI